MQIKNNAIQVTFDYEIKIYDFTAEQLNFIFQSHTSKKSYDTTCQFLMVNLAE